MNNLPILNFKFHFHLWCHQIILACFWEDQRQARDKSHWILHNIYLKREHVDRHKSPDYCTLKKGNESTFTVYFSPGLQWCCGSCHLLCPPVPLMLPLAVTHHHHVSHPRCPSTMHTQTSYSFHPKDEAGSHHVSSLECRRANGKRRKRRGSQRPDPPSFRIWDVKDSDAKELHHLPLLLLTCQKSLLRRFHVKRQDSAYLCLKMYSTPGPASLLSKQRVLRHGTALQHFLYLSCVHLFPDSEFKKFHSTTTGMSRLRDKLVDVSNILLRENKRKILFV